MAIRMSLKATTAAVGLMLAALPAAAQSVKLACGFTSECFEGDGCRESDLSFTMTIHSDPNAPKGDDRPIPSLGEIRDEGETLIGEVIRLDTGAIIYRSNFRIVNDRIRVAPPALLTVVPRGEARYTLQFMDVPLAITYRGRCAPEEPAAPETQGQQDQ